MIPSAFEYHAPTSLGEALTLLGRYGDGAKLLAGGHSLLPALKLRLQSVEHLIDLGRIQDLRYVHSQGDKLDLSHISDASGKIDESFITVHDRGDLLVFSPQHPRPSDR